MVYSLESVKGVNRVAEGGRTLEGSKAEESELMLGKVVLWCELAEEERLLARLSWLCREERALLLLLLLFDEGNSDFRLEAEDDDRWF